VKLNVAVHKILSVDLYGGTLKLAVWMREEWWDPRLTWDAKQWNVTKLWFSNPQQGDTEIWEVGGWNGLAAASGCRVGLGWYTSRQTQLGVCVCVCVGGGAHERGDMEVRGVVD